MVIAFFILLVACVNFTNLSTANAMRRYKEVGIRKVLGSRRSGLIYQFLSESILTSVLALVLAVCIALTLLPYFNQLAGKQISFATFFTPWVIILLLILAIGIGLLAGLYPSLFLSSFTPIRALKGKWSGGNPRNGLKNSLVVFQFTTAMILIVGTLVIYSQLHYIQHKKLGYNRDHILMVENLYSLGSHRASFKQEVLQLPGVQAATVAGTFPTSLIYDQEAFSKSATGDARQTAILGHWEVDADYIPTLKMTMLQGRNFSSQMSTDSSALIINETAARMLGFTDPLHKILYLKNNDNTSYPVHIIGVVQDFNTGSLRHQIVPVAFTLAGQAGRMAVRVHTDRLPALISQIKNKYQQAATIAGQPFVYSFMDDDFDHLYRSEQRTGLLFIYFTCFAIGIACLGLFGLVAFSVERRTKEIGIRRVLGATVPGLVALLSRDFLKLVCISVVIAVPIAWWGMHLWLQGFAYRTALHAWIFLLAGILVLLIACGTVGAKAARAAMANPVKSLRTE
jgi:putative ABC transport system permease protein